MCQNRSTTNARHASRDSLTPRCSGCHVIGTETVGPARQHTRRAIAYPSPLLPRSNPPFRFVFITQYLPMQYARHMSPARHPPCTSRPPSAEGVHHRLRSILDIRCPPRNREAVGEHQIRPTIDKMNDSFSSIVQETKNQSSARPWRFHQEGQPRHGRNRCRLRKQVVFLALRRGSFQLPH